MITAAALSFKAAMSHWKIKNNANDEDQIKSRPARTVYTDSNITVKGGIGTLIRNDHKKKYLPTSDKNENKKQNIEQIKENIPVHMVGLYSSRIFIIHNRLLAFRVQLPLYVGPWAPRQRFYFKLHAHVPKAYPAVIPKGDSSDFMIWFIFSLVVLGENGQDFQDFGSPDLSCFDWLVLSNGISSFV